jgi:hypothetical protein
MGKLRGMNWLTIISYGKFALDILNIDGMLALVPRHLSYICALNFTI